MDRIGDCTVQLCPVPARQNQFFFGQHSITIGIVLIIRLAWQIER